MCVKPDGEGGARVLFSGLYHVGVNQEARILLGPSPQFNNNVHPW